MSPAGMLDTQRMAIDRFWQLARQGMLLASGMHGVFALVGWIAGAMPLVALQAVTVAVYAASYVLSGRGNRWLPIALAWFDLLGHATFAGWLVGVDGGFQYYSWILLPLVFANVHRGMRTKAVLAVALSASFVAIDWWLYRSTPVLTLDSAALAALRGFNIVCFLMALGVIAAMHARTVDEAARRLTLLANTDTLTGLLNRRRMTDRIQRELINAEAGGGPWSVMLLDIDNFKSINDSFGHARGDQVIVAVGAALRASVRREDWVARWGGEEFLVAMRGASLLFACETAERIRRAISASVVQDESSGTPVTVTIGVAAWREGENLEEILHRADAALYAGKRAGRNRVMADHENSGGGPDDDAQPQTRWQAAG